MALPRNAGPHDEEVPMKPRAVTVLGATGSVGRSTLDLIGRTPERFEVVALTAGSMPENWPNWLSGIAPGTPPSPTPHNISS